MSGNWHPVHVLPLIVLISCCALPGVYAKSSSHQPKDEAMTIVEQIVERRMNSDVPDYQDDRSSPEALIASYYNALNRAEFSRAYSYLSEERRPDFLSWVQGYKNTRSIRVIAGKAESDNAAGTWGWDLPVAIEAENYDGTKEVFRGCYLVTMTAPVNQILPPYRAMTIAFSSSLKKSAQTINESLAATCNLE